MQFSNFYNSLHAPGHIKNLSAFLKGRISPYQGTVAIAELSSTFFTFLYLSITLWLLCLYLLSQLDDSQLAINLAHLEILLNSLIPPSLRFHMIISR